MILCSCNVLSDDEICRAIKDIHRFDKHAVITPGLVFKTLGRRPDCGGCMPSVVALIRDEAERVRQSDNLETPDVMPEYALKVAAE